MTSSSTVETIVKAVIVLLGIEWAIKHQDVIQGWINNFTMAVQTQTGAGSMMMPTAMDMSGGAMMNSAVVPADMMPAAMNNVTPAAGFDCSQLASCMCVDIGGSCKCVGNSECSCSSCVAGGGIMMNAVVTPMAQASPKNVVQAAKDAVGKMKPVAKIGPCGPNTPCGTMCTMGKSMLFNCCVGPTKKQSFVLSSRACATANKCTVRANGICM
jgi:hypothetical protein